MDGFSGSRWALGSARYGCVWLPTCLPLERTSPLFICYRYITSGRAGTGRPARRRPISPAENDDKKDWGLAAGGEAGRRRCLCGAAELRGWNETGAVVTRLADNSQMPRPGRQPLPKEAKITARRGVETATYCLGETTGSGRGAGGEGDGEEPRGHVRHAFSQGSWLMFPLDITSALKRGIPTLTRLLGWTMADRSDGHQARPGKPWDSLSAGASLP